MIITVEILILLISGVFAGVLAGLLGIGGGSIIVTILVWVLHAHKDIPQEHTMHIAIGTSLATIVVTSISSILAHQRRKAIQWHIVQQLMVGIIVGTLLGTIIADMISTEILKIIFGVFVLVISIQLGFGVQPTPHRQLPQWLGMNTVGMVIGNISALVGIGGGSLTVPFLAWCNIPIRHAIATSAACGLPIAIAGTMGFIITGWQPMNLVDWCVGYIYLPAFLAIAATSLLFAPLGAKLAHTAPIALLKRFFALFLVVIGIKMLFY